MMDKIFYILDKHGIPLFLLQSVLSSFLYIGIMIGSFHSSDNPGYPHQHKTTYLPVWLLFLDRFTLKMKALWSLETSATIYSVMQH